MNIYMQYTDGLVIKTDTPEHFSGAKKLTRKAGAEALKAQAFKKLHKVLKPRDTVYCILRNVSRSGMSRQIDFYTKRMECISRDVADLLEYQTTSNHALKVGGCGMDMGFSVVYNLGAVMWPNGTKKPHGTRNGEPDSAGGYALKHKWV